VPADRTAAAIFVAATAAAAMLARADEGVYSFLIGGVDPFLLTVVIASLGALALRLLVRYGWYGAGARSARSLWVALGVGACLTIPVIVIDGMGGFLADMNVPAPASLLFYPSIALVAESTFHLVPIALVAFLWKRTRFELTRTRLFAMGAAAVIEPFLQVVWGVGHSPLWVNAYVGAHLLAFNVIALVFFRYSGFVALYAFRLGYYLVWHVAWGHLRLGLLFGGEA